MTNSMTRIIQATEQVGKKCKNVLSLFSLVILATVAARGSTYTIDPVVGKMNNGENIHIFSGYGFYGSELAAYLDLRSTTGIPLEGRKLYIAYYPELIGGRLELQKNRKSQDFDKIRNLQKTIIKSDAPLKLEMRSAAEVTLDLTTSYCDYGVHYGGGCTVEDISRNVKFTTDAIDVHFESVGKTMTFVSYESVPIFNRQVILPSTDRDIMCINSKGESFQGEFFSLGPVIYINTTNLTITNKINSSSYSLGQSSDGRYAIYASGGYGDSETNDSADFLTFIKDPTINKIGSASIGDAIFDDCSMVP